MRRNLQEWCVVRVLHYGRILIAKQDAPHISRFNSQSTGNATLVGSEHGFGTPMSPYPLDYNSALTPTIPHSGQWFYLDKVPTKLLKELQRQCDPSGQTKDVKHPLAKGAAKIRAWARPGKMGIDIKLRQKITADHDEVTQIHLEPELDFLKPEKLFVAELPEAPEVSELADVNEPQELPAELLAAYGDRSSGTFSDADTLPRYEPRRNASQKDVADTVRGAESTPPLERGRERRNSASGFSFMPTPPRGLSLSRSDQPGESDSGNRDNEKASQPEVCPDVSHDAQPIEQQTDLDRVSSQLQQERDIRTRYESLLQDVKDELSKQRHERQQSADAEVKQMLTGLKVAKTARYETETDVEPPSPSDHRTHVRTPPRMRKHHSKPKGKSGEHKIRSAKGSGSKAYVHSRDSGYAFLQHCTSGTLRHRITSRAEHCYTPENVSSLFLQATD